MLSTLLKNGMVLGVKNAKISNVEIRKSMASKYISGYAVYTHPLSDKEWRSIALPYNLTQEQVNTTFGSDALVCELGPSIVTKTKVDKDGVSYSYGIALNFQKITNGINANYPYIIKMGTGKVASDNAYTIHDVKADVRDFQAYEFRTPEFKLADTFMTEEPKAGDEDYTQNKNIWDFEQQIKEKVSGAYMIFQSTAPVFDITNASVGEVETISGVNQYTTLEVAKDQEKEYTNYFFNKGELIPVLTKNINLKSGLAYVKFPPQTYSLFSDNTNHPSEVSLAKISYVFPDESGTTGIEEILVPTHKQDNKGIYTLGGQLVRNDVSFERLAKGVYIVNGKKVIVK